jgi:hypothetical protein
MRTALRVKFPDHQGKYREFSRFRPPEAAWKPKNSYILAGFCLNSLLDGTGNFRMLSGNFIGGSGNFLVITGNPVKVHSPDLARYGITSGG